MLNLQKAYLRHAQYYKNKLSEVADLYSVAGDNVKQSLILLDKIWPNIQLGQAWATTNVENDLEAKQLCCDYPNVGSNILNLYQHPLDVIKWRNDGLVSARSLKRLDSECLHLNNLGNSYLKLGNPSKAIEYLKGALQISQEIEDRFEEATALDSLGSAYADLGKFPKAIEYYEQALIIARQLKDEISEGASLSNLGNAFADLGNYDKAIEYGELALNITHKLNLQIEKSTVLTNLGAIHYILGNFHKAIEYHNQALGVVRNLGLRSKEGDVLNNISTVYAELGEDQKAFEVLQNALVIHQETNNLRSQAMTLFNLSMVSFVGIRKPKNAMVYAQASQKAFKESGCKVPRQIQFLLTILSSQSLTRLFMLLISLFSIIRKTKTPKDKLTTN